MSMKPKTDRIKCGIGQECVQFNGFVQQTIGSYESFMFALFGIVNVKFSGAIRIRKALGFGFLRSRRRSITIYTIMFSSRVLVEGTAWLSGPMEGPRYKHGIQKQPS